MHDARGVANHFLDLAKLRGIDVTAMTLLKILYFAHGWHLAKYGRPLVAQPFEAWQHGPVNRVVYDQIKGLDAAPVKKRLQAFSAEICGYLDAQAELDSEVVQFLSNVFDYYSRFHAFKLSDLTHEQGSPWDIVWQTAESQAVAGMLIPDSLILDWFRAEGRRMKKSS